MALKTTTLTIKVTPEDKEKIREEAAAAGLTVSLYLYNMVFNGEEVNNEQ